MLERLSARAYDGLRGWVGVILRHPVLVVLLALVLTVVSVGYTARNLGINTDTVDMISADVPFRRDTIAFREAFPAFVTPIVAVIEGPTPELAAEAARELAQALEADELHFEAVEYMQGEPFFIEHGLLYLDLDELAELSDRLAAAQPLLAALAQDPSLRGLAHFVDLAVGNPEAEAELPDELHRLFADMADAVEAQLLGTPGQVSWQALMTDAGELASTRQLVIAQPHEDPEELIPAAGAIDALRAHAAGLGIGPADGFRFRLTGSPVLEQEELESVAAGATLASAITTVAVAVLLVWGLKSLRLIVATLATLFIGLSLTAAFATLAIGELNLISVAFAVLFVGLGVDFGIHLTLRYREAAAEIGFTEGALRHAVMGVAGPLSLSALCAAIGFLAFAPTDYKGLAELGVISAGGMGIAWFTSISLLPALICLMPAPPGLRPRRRPAIPRPRYEHYNKTVLVVAGIAGIAAATALPQVRFDFDPMNLRDPAAESVATFRELAAAQATSPYSIDVLAPDLEQARAFADRLEALPEVGRTITIGSLVPAEQEEKLEILDDLAFYLGPMLAVDPIDDVSAEVRAAAALRLQVRLEQANGGAGRHGADRLADALARFKPARQDGAELAELERRLVGSVPLLLEQLNRALDAGPVQLDDLPGHVRERWLSPAGEARVVVQPAEFIADTRALGSFARAVLEEAPRATGMPVIVTQASEAVVLAFRQAGFLALILITLVLGLVLRNSLDVLLVLAPIGLAVLYTAATAVLLDLEFNFANVIVLPLLLGLGVSGAIHVVMRRQQEMEHGGLFATSTPRAVLFSALTTIASFGSLAISAHRGLASMGQLLVIAILWSLVCTLVVLPSVLVLLRPRLPEDETA